MLAINPLKGLIKELKLDKTYKQLQISPFTIFGMATMAFTPQYLVLDFYYYHTGIDSNVVNENDSLFYVSDRKRLRCIDRNLNEVWKTKLPFEYPSENSGASQLSLHGDTLELLNTGLVLTYEDTIRVSQPFIASFNKKTGEKLSKEEYPEKFNIGLFGERIIHAIHPFFIHDPESKTYRLYKHPSLQYPVKVANEEIFIVDTNLGFIDKFTEKEIYLPINTYKDYTILSHKTSTEPDFWMDFIIDSDGKMVEGTYTDKKIHFVDHGKIYIEDGDSFNPAPFSVGQQTD